MDAAAGIMRYIEVSTKVLVIQVTLERVDISTAVQTSIAYGYYYCSMLHGCLVMIKWLDYRTCVLAANVRCVAQGTNPNSAVTRASTRHIEVDHENVILRAGATTKHELARREKGDGTVSKYDRY